MKTKKTCKVVMLPTDKASHIHKIGNEIGYTNKSNNNPFAKQQHLYLVSDDEIKEGDCKKGDWYYSPIHNQLFQVIHDKQYLEEDYKKVIATTDSSLKWTDDNYIQVIDHFHGSLPQIPESFIQAYVKAGGKIDEVQIKVVEHTSGELGQIDKIWHTYKLRPDNTVIIHRTKDKKYSREEVISLLCDFAESEVGSNWQEITNVDKWIEDNL
jgi:hypothetical protein